MTTPAGPNAAARVADLIAALQDVIDDHGPDATFAVATQPNYPLRLEVVGIAATLDIIDDLTRDAREANPGGPDDVDGDTLLDELPTVWLVTDAPNAYDVNPYADAALWSAASDITDAAMNRG